MIRQSPEVPAAVELADVSKHIMRTEFTFADSAFYGAWVWQSPMDYDPMLRVLVAFDDRTIRKNGDFLIKATNLVISEKSTEYWLTLPIRTADRIEDDPFIEDFLEAFRQYPYGRSQLIIPSQTE